MLDVRLNLPGPIRSAALVCAIAVAELLVSCSSGSKPEQHTQEQHTQEQYTKVNDAEALDVDLRGTLSFHVDNGTMKDVSIHVEHFSVGGKDIELLSRDLANGDDGFWMQTKAYGRMKVTGSRTPENRLELWLTPSQRIAFKALQASQAKGK